MKEGAEVMSIKLIEVFVNLTENQHVSNKKNTGDAFLQAQ